jgi:hypothetical protein
MDPLIDYYERVPGENPELHEYRARMRRERRVLIPDRAHAPIDEHRREARPAGGPLTGQSESADSAVIP